MRNFVSSLLAVITGSTTIVIFFGVIQQTYPEPFNHIWFLLDGSTALQSALLGPITPLHIVLYISSWLVIGAIIGPFSRPGWNTVRSMLWVGLIHAIFALVSLLLLNPEFWGSANRNFDLLSQFSASLILATISLPSAIPIAMLTERLGRQAEPPIPLKIETICECGAIFKSNPLICSECGRTLNSEVD